jgi:uncharacterized membrane protein (UPF0127 family)
MKLLPRLLALGFAAASLSACASTAGDGPWVELKGKRFSVEIADDPAERERGLMFRDEMAADHGMLFVHDGEEVQSYWMKNTKIPLDIAYFDHAHKLVSVAHAPPCSLGDRLPAVPERGPGAVRARAECRRRGRTRRGRRRRAEIRPRDRGEEVALDLRRARVHIAPMHGRYVLPDWNSLAACGDDELPLLDTALLIARDEYPALDAGAYASTIQGYADALKPRLHGDVDLPATLTTINRYLFEELGFAGNNSQYDDPRNSYLNEVFDRKLGIPISLAVVQIELTRRLGLPLDGISFPGHFLVRLPVDDGILVMDPYNKGRPVSADELKERASPHLGGNAADDVQLIEILAPGHPPRDPVAHAAQPQRPVPAAGRLGAGRAHLRPAAEDLARDTGAVARPRTGLPRAGLCEGRARRPGALPAEAAERR